MPLIDSRVLLKLVTGDTPGQARRASDLITGYGENELMLPDFGLAELADELAYNPRYRWPREAIAEALDDIAVIPQLELSAAARRALDTYRRADAPDFSSCLLHAHAKASRTSVVMFEG